MKRQYRGWIEIHKWTGERFSISIRNGGKHRMVIKIGYFHYVIMWGDTPKDIK